MGSSPVNGRSSSRLRLVAAAPWIVVMAGVLVMIVLMVVAAGYLAGDRPPVGQPDPQWPFGPGNTASPPPVAEASPSSSRPAGNLGRSFQSTARPVDPTSPTGPAATSSPPGPPRSGTPTARPSASSVPPQGQWAGLSAQYQVVNNWPGSFIAEVRVRNATPTHVPWTVELRFSSNAERLLSYWAEGAPQPLLHRPGAGYVFTGREPLSAGATLRLRVHLMGDGRTDRPTVCTVNGVPCTLG